jgi:hypothetical protein
MAEEPISVRLQAGFLGGPQAIEERLAAPGIRSRQQLDLLRREEAPGDT